MSKNVEKWLKTWTVMSGRVLFWWQNFTISLQQIIVNSRVNQKAHSKKENAFNDWHITDRKFVMRLIIFQNQPQILVDFETESNGFR